MYRSVVITAARYTLILVSSVMPRRFHKFFLSLRNADLALANLTSTSSSMTTFLESVLPRQVNLSTAFKRSPLMVMLVSIYVLPGAGWCINSVFLMLIVGPKLVQASANLSSITINGQRLKAVDKFTYLDSKLPDTEVVARAGLSSTHKLLKKYQIRWAGHLARMPDNWLPKKLLFGKLRHGPKKRYKDTLQGSIKSFKLNPDTWEQTAQNRSE